MNPWSKYVIANSVEEALTSLASAPGRALPVAGGTDLMLDLQQLPVSSQIHTLVDLTNIPEMKCLELRGDTLFIGASVPVKVVTESLLIQQHAIALSEACGLIGGPQVRNTATLGGNIAHALPAADGTIALVALNATVEIAGPSGRRLEPILNIFKGVGQSNLVKDREILVGFHIAKQLSGQASAFKRVMRPQGVALPVLNLAIWLQRNEKMIEDIRVAVGPAGPIPQRASEIEKLLQGAVFSKELIEQAKVLVDTTMHFRTSPMRATSQYRYHLCKVLLDESLKKAWNRASLLEQK
jgi:xanthine dehydrogenase FAD-binding subunit